MRGPLTLNDGGVWARPNRVFHPRLTTTAGSIAFRKSNQLNILSLLTSAVALLPHLEG
jgi:hypothetical protein